MNISRWSLWRKYRVPNNLTGFDTNTAVHTATHLWIYNIENRQIRHIIPVSPVWELPLWIKGDFQFCQECIFFISYLSTETGLGYFLVLASYNKVTATAVIWISNKGNTNRNERMTPRKLIHQSVYLANKMSDVLTSFYCHLNCVIKWTKL